jgi:hypothetical protein
MRGDDARIADLSAAAADLSAAPPELGLTPRARENSLWRVTMALPLLPFGLSREVDHLPVGPLATVQQRRYSSDWDGATS